VIELAVYGDSAASRVAALDGRRVATCVGDAVSRVRRAGSSSSAAWEGIAGDQFCGALSDAERQLDDLRERITPAAHLRSAAGPLAGGLRLRIGCSVRPRRLQRGDETVDLTEPGGQLALEGVEVADDRRHLVQVHREAGYDNRCSSRLTTGCTDACDTLSLDRYVVRVLSSSSAVRRRAANTSSAPRHHSCHAWPYSLAAGPVQPPVSSALTDRSIRRRSWASASAAAPTSKRV